ncbi:hypothetical protein [Bacillus phage SBSphiJ7]|nr:hypothetical protein [Bacillus phage SBSphiJ7]
MRGKAVYLTREEMRLIDLCLNNVEPDDFIDTDLFPMEISLGIEPDHKAYRAWHSVKDKLFKALGGDV